MRQVFRGMISHPDSRASLTISTDASRSNRTFKSPAATTIHRTGLVFAALMLWMSACSPTTTLNGSPPADPQPAPGKVFVKAQWFGPKLREAALAGEHPASPDMPIRVCVVLTMLHGDEFNQRAAAFMDHSSPSFGGQFTDEELKRYARPMSDYESVERWLTLYGIKILNVGPEPLIHTVRVQGTAAQFESAMNVRIDQSADGKWFANMSDPQIPTELNGVIAGFVGLDDLSAFGPGPRISSCV